MYCWVKGKLEVVRWRNAQSWDAARGKGRRQEALQRQAGERIGRVLGFRAIARKPQTTHGTKIAQAGSHTRYSGECTQQGISKLSFQGTRDTKADPTSAASTSEPSKLLPGAAFTGLQRGDSETKAGISNREDCTDRGH